MVTNIDQNIGVPTKRTVNASRTFQFYNGNPAGLSVGALVQARVESIGVNVLNRVALGECYFNYCDAALLELFLESGQQQSFAGK